MNGKELFEYAQLTNSEDLLKTNDECDEHYLTYLCLSARKKYPPAIYKMAKIFELGEQFGKITITPNKTISLRLLKIASCLGNGEAMAEMAGIYFKQGNIEIGKRLLLNAAHALSPNALYALSACYQDGLYGFEKNIDEAEKFLRLANKLDC